MKPFDLSQHLTRSVFNAKDSPFNAKGDNVDDRTALMLADAAGPFLLPLGLYRITAATTFNNVITFMPGAFLVTDGAIVTFNKDPIAGDYQIFIPVGSGNVAGIKHLNAAWFIGEYLGTLTDVTAAINKMDGATARGSRITFPVGDFHVDGSTPLLFTKGQRIEGAGAYTTRLRWLGSTRHGFRFTTTEGARLENFGFLVSDAQIPVIATAGIAACFIDAGAVNAGFSDLRINGGWNGVVAQNGNGVEGRDSLIGDCAHTGLYLINHVNFQFNGIKVSAFSDWLYSNTTAGFISGESVTWPGGSGMWGYSLSGTVSKFFINDNTPAPGTVLTGGTSGSTCTVTSVVKGHQTGGLGLKDHVEGGDFVNCSWAGGLYAALGVAAVNAHGSRTEFVNFTNCYFDNSDKGADFSYMTHTMFTAQWAACRNGNGITLRSSPHVAFTIPKIIECWEHGISIDNQCQSFNVHGGTIAANNRGNIIGGDGIHIAAGATDFIIQGVRLGGASIYGATHQRYAVAVETGSSDRYIIADNNVGGNATGTVFDGGTGVDKRVQNI